MTKVTWKTVVFQGRRGSRGSGFKSKKPGFDGKTELDICNEKRSFVEEINNKKVWDFGTTMAIQND